MSLHNPHLAYRPDVDGLRAIAVGLVVAFHAFPAAVPAGFIGVDLFFVISGYLISGIIIKGLERGEFSLREFYARRIRRIFPALSLVLVTCLGIGWWSLHSPEYKALGRQVLWGAGFAGNLLMKREAGYFDSAAELKPLLHLWSLGIEEQFYLLWPLLLIVAYRYRAKLWVLIGGLLLLSFAANLWRIEGDPSGVFYSPHTRFWELWVGAALALIDRRYRGTVTDCFHRFIPVNFPATNAMAIVGVLLLMAALGSIDRRSPFPGALALLPTLAAFLLIAAGPRAWVNRQVLASRPLVLVGLISYPLYLWHWPLFSFARILEQGHPPVAVVLCALGLSIVLAWATYALVEKRVRFRSHWGVTATLVAVLVLMALAGDQVTRHAGFPERMRGYEDNPKIEDLKSFFRELTSLGPDCAPPELLARALRHNGIPRCRQTLPADVPQQVALIGDSHAEHYFPGFARHVFPNDNLMYFTNGCLPFWNLTGYPDCPNVSVVLDHVVAQRSVHTVVLGNIWQGWWNGPKLRLSDAPELTDPAERFKLAMAQTLRRLLVAGKRVIVVYNAPLLGFTPEACLGRPVSLTRPPRTPCAVARSDVDAQQAAYRRLIEAVLQEFPDVEVWDPLPFFCDAQWCRAASDGIALYRDDNHLTTPASYQLGQYFAARGGGKH